MTVSCWQCRANIKSSSAYCPDCGAAVEARVSVASTRPRRGRAPFGGLLVAVVAIAAFVMIDTSPPPEPVADDIPAALETLSASAQPRFETLGRPTGTTAIVLTKDALELIDLDSADRKELPLPSEIPVDTVDVGRRLLLHDSNLLIPAGTVVWSLDLETGRFVDLGPGDRVAPALTPGHTWIWTALTASWREVDRDGGTQRELQWPGAGHHWDHGAGTPELTAAPGGGIYRLDDDSSWRLLADGVPLAGNNSAALIQECASLEDCDYRWASMRSGAELKRWLPPNIEDSTARRYRLSPSGESLLEMSPTTRSWEAVYVYNDGLVRSTACSQGWESASWSADESVLACVLDRGIAITDLANGPAAVFDDWDDPPLAAVLADTASIGLDPQN